MTRAEPTGRKDGSSLSDDSSFSGFARLLLVVVVPMSSPTACFAALKQATTQSSKWKNEPKLLTILR